MDHARLCRGVVCRGFPGINNVIIGAVPALCENAPMCSSPMHVIPICPALCALKWQGRCSQFTFLLSECLFFLSRGASVMESGFHSFAPYGTFQFIRGSVPVADDEGPIRTMSPKRVAFLVLAFLTLSGLVLSVYPGTGRPKHTLDTANNNVAAQKGSGARHRRPTVYRYGIMMDLGSTGSRLFVYRWQPRTPLRSIIQLGSEDTSPGVSFYCASAGGHTVPAKEVSLRVSTSLLPLIHFAKTIVPPWAVPTTGIRAKCTAGCRLLLDGDVSAIMDGVRGALAQSGFRFEPSYAAQIPGEVEAILDWVSINAALGLLHQQAYRGDAARVSVAPTVGVMDIGGGSAQIAYPVVPAAAAVARASAPKRVFYGDAADAARPVVLAYGNGLFHLRLVNGVEHTIYAVSRMHYGMHDAQKLVVSNDVDRAHADPRQNTQMTTDRAAPAERTAPGRAAHAAAEARMFEHPCLQRDVYDRTIRGRYVTGTGDADACLGRVSKWVAWAEEHDVGNASWAFPVPPLDLPFLPFAGMNNFYRLYNFAKHVLGLRDHLLDPGTVANATAEASSRDPPLFTTSKLMTCMRTYPAAHPDVFLRAARVTCPMPFDELQLRHGNLLPDSQRLRDSCFGLVWMKVLLSKVYDFAKKQTFYSMSQTVRCPGINLPDIDKQFPGHAATESNLHATYDSTWTLGGMVLDMEQSEAR